MCIWVCVYACVCVHVSCCVCCPLDACVACCFKAYCAVNFLGWNNDTTVSTQFVTCFSRCAYCWHKLAQYKVLISFQICICIHTSVSLCLALFRCVLLCLLCVVCLASTCYVCSWPCLAVPCSEFFVVSTCFLSASVNLFHSCFSLLCRDPEHDVNVVSVFKLRHFSLRLLADFYATFLCICRSHPQANNRSNRW